MFLGIDLGTSGVKVVLVDDDQTVIDQATAPLQVSMAQPLWSEQDPESWWQATCDAIATLRAGRADELQAVRGIGLSGQMHGATLLDASDRVLRPAILWNDGRSAAECAELERRVRALNPWPGAFAELPSRKGVERVKVLAAELAETAGGVPGEVLDKALTVSCGAGALRLMRVQRAGRGAMSTEAFLHGAAIAPGTRLPLPETGP